MLRFLSDMMSGRLGKFARHCQNLPDNVRMIGGFPYLWAFFFEVAGSSSLDDLVNFAIMTKYIKISTKMHIQHCIKHFSLRQWCHGPPNILLLMMDCWSKMVELGVQNHGYAGAVLSNLINHIKNFRDNLLRIYIYRLYISLYKINLNT